MSYAPRTKLSCDSSSCTVLNDDYVFVSWGLGINQRMPLADWRIIIGDEPVREEYIPLAPLGPTPTVCSALAAPAAFSASAALLTTPTAAAEIPVIGTKWVWSMTGDHHNYRVAINTRNGVLQVKKVSCSPPAGYAVELARQMFPTYKDWEDSLPCARGTITTTLPQDRLSELEKRKKHSAKMLADGGTADAILKLQELWYVRTRIFRNQSVNQRLTYSENEVARLRDQLQKLTVEDDMNSPHMRRSITRRLANMCGMLSSLRACVARQTPEENSHRNAYLTDSYKQRLYIHTSQGKLQIAYDIVSQSIAVRIPTGTQVWMHRVDFVKRLEDLPFSVGAELHLSVSYRRKEIDLYASP